MRGLRGGTSRAAEESLRTGEAKISDKPRDTRLANQKKKNKKRFMAQSADALERG